MYFIFLPLNWKFIASIISISPNSFYLGYINPIVILSHTTLQLPSFYVEDIVLWSRDGFIFENMFHCKHWLICLKSIFQQFDFFPVYIGNRKIEVLFFEIWSIIYLINTELFILVFHFYSISLFVVLFLTKIFTSIKHIHRTTLYWNKKLYYGCVIFIAKCTKKSRDKSHYPLHFTVHENQWNKIVVLGDTGNLTRQRYGKYV